MIILSALLGGLWSMLIGTLWYSNLLFGRPWRHLLGIKMISMTSQDMARTFGTTFVLYFFAALLLAFSVGPWYTVGSNLMAIVLVWCVFTFIPMAVSNLYTARSWKLTLIDAGYQLVTFLGITFIAVYLH